MIEQIEKSFKESIEVKKNTLDTLLPQVKKAADLILETLDAGNKILSCGNGGSAGDAQHLTAELVNRFEIERKNLPAIALTADIVTMTAIANDYHYNKVFSKQIKALGLSNDLLIVFSTSGQSKNIVEAIETAQKQNLSIIAFTGKDGGQVGKLLNHSNPKEIELRIPSSSTARIQEVHLLIIHCLCSIVDQHFSS